VDLEFGPVIFLDCGNVIAFHRHVKATIIWYGLVAHLFEVVQEQSVNLLLTCSTTPEFSQEALDLWNKFCIAEWMPGHEVVPYLMFASASSSASIDAIVFLRPSMSMGFVHGANGHLSYPEITSWDAPWLNAEIAQRIRDLPETCAMRDGRKWKRIPQIILYDNGPRQHHAYEGLDVEYVQDVTEWMLHSGYASPFTWDHIEKVVSRYNQKALKEYEHVGFLVTADHGLYRVKRAFHKKRSDESDFYYGGKDKRRFHGFVTVGRDSEGINYEALLFEQLLNDLNTGEREVHNFLEQHPDLLAEAMMGVPISHKPYFPANKQTPDFAISPVLPRDGGDWVKLLELKGPDAKILDSRKYLHRGLAPAVTRALAQVNDYNESIRDPLNLKSIEKALGYIPESSERAVLIGRAPAAQDLGLWDKRKAEQPSVSIITYDDLLQEQRGRHAWRRRHCF